MNNEIRFEKREGAHGTWGIITLSRPEALNALTFTMCAEIHKHLSLWSEDSNIEAVIIRGEGDRAFCAGGDIRSIYTDKAQHQAGDIDFFKTEYDMNTALFHFKKPYIALLHGITMGGGCGVSMYGSHRIATPDLRFAMPETGIGFFPDIGSAYFLTQAPGKLGWYVGLTGNTITAADAFHLGFVTAIMDDDTRKIFCETLIDSTLEIKPITKIIKKFHQDAGESELLKYQKIIDACFSQTSIEAIFNALAKNASNFAKETLNTLQKRSPTSLRITFDHLNSSVGKDFDTIIKRDYELAQEFLHSHDFFEGIRAAIIDKDQRPNWEPPSIHVT